MKRLLTLCFFLILGSLSAQQFFLELGRVSSRFDYESSTGEALENDFPEANMSAVLGYRMALAERFFAVGGISYNRYGTYGSYSEYNLSYDYRTDYLGLKLGLEGEFYKRSGFTFLAGLCGEPQFLLNGSRTLNSQTEDLKGSEDFDTPFFFAKGGLGVNYCADKIFAITFRYDYGMGFQLNSTDETLRYGTQTISLGLLVNINRCDYCTKFKTGK